MHNNFFFACNPTLGVSFPKVAKMPILGHFVKTIARKNLKNLGFFRSEIQKAKNMANLIGIVVLSVLCKEKINFEKWQK